MIHNAARLCLLSDDVISVVFTFHSVMEMCVCVYSAMAVESVTVAAPDVWVGKLFLSTGLMEQINDFHTLSLKEFPAFDAHTFLTVYEDYFYHTANPRRPEVSTGLCHLTRVCVCV